MLTFSATTFPFWMGNENFTYWQAAERTINSLHQEWERWFCHALFYYLHIELYSNPLGVNTFQKTKENLSRTSICPSSILFCKSWKFLKFRVDREKGFILVLLSTTFKDLSGWRTSFSLAVKSLCVTKKQSLKNAFSTLWIKNNSNNPYLEIWKTNTVPSWYLVFIILNLFFNSAHCVTDL